MVWLVVAVAGPLSCDQPARQAAEGHLSSVTLADRIACNSAVEKSWDSNPAIEPGSVGHGSLATSDGHCLIWWDSVDVAPAHSYFTFQIEDVFSRETLASGSYHCSWKNPEDITKGCKESLKSACEFRHADLTCAQVQQRVRTEWPELYEVVTGIEGWTK